MPAPDEFAEPYSRAERLRFVVIGSLAGAAAVGAGKRWLFPGLRAFAATAPCRSILGIPGQMMLAYGLFVGLPLLAACVVSATVGRRGVRILRDGQFPPRGEKVFRPTRVVRGRRATLLGCAHVLATVPLVLVTLWGAEQASEWSRSTRPRFPVGCVTEHAHPAMIADHLLHPVLRGN